MIHVKYRYLLVVSLITVVVGFVLLFQQLTPQSTPSADSDSTESVQAPSGESLAATPLPAIPPVHTITMPYHTYQSFNNCGPATLSMYMHYLGVPLGQDELGAAIRPYQNAAGDNDDKSVTLPELARAAEERGYVAYYRPAGDRETVKRFIAAEIPVIVRTWLEPGDDIGHYRIIRGYDDTSGVFLQDDSYQGPDRTYTYAAFEEIWRPFQQEYLVIVPAQMRQEVEAIIGEALDQQVAWKRARSQAQQDAIAHPESPYPIFNESIAQYHLGNYAHSVELYEQVAARLPNNILWYQIEPIAAYAKVGNRQRVFEMSDAILNGGNRAYSELFMIRGGIYESEGDIEAARAEYERAVFYNTNLQEPQIALERLTQTQ